MKLIAVVITLLLATVYASPNQSLRGKLQTRVNNGKLAKRINFPYMVRLDIGRNGKLLCGGTLISDKHILTAAHCFHNREEKKTYKHVTAILGDTDISLKSDNNRIEIEVNFNEDVTIHKDYKKSSRSRHDDIAIITLPHAVQLNEFIKPAILPKRSQNSFEGKMVTVSGWGKKGDKSETGSNHLLYGPLKIVPDSDCQKDKTYKKYFAPNKQLCAKNKMYSACAGDSGGPYIYTENNLHTVVGIVSYGDEYCENDNPDVMTNVHYYLDWISEKTGITLDN